MTQTSLAPGTDLFLALKRTASTFEEIPVIDIRAAYGNDLAARRELADLIRDACINVGFFYIQSHDIPEEVIDNTITAAKEYFSLPEQTKMELDIHKTSNFKGYTALLGENTDSTGLGDLHEGFDLGWEANQQTFPPAAVRDDGAMAGNNVWPHGVPGFRERVLDYYHRVLRVGQLLFPLFALALELPENFFDDKTTKPAAIMRLLHYPPQCPTSFETDPDGRQIGIGAHTDYECFTILWQDRSGGLQVQNTTGKWVDAVPIPGTLVVNLGDQFARWTNDVFKSTLHRVINRSGAERYSIPLFLGTNYDVLLEDSPYRHALPRTSPVSMRSLPLGNMSNPGWKLHMRIPWVDPLLVMVANRQYLLPCQSSILMYTLSFCLIISCPLGKYLCFEGTSLQLQTTSGTRILAVSGVWLARCPWGLQRSTTKSRHYLPDTWDKFDSW